ncbi:hypothetical protein ACHAWF_003167, partial [Thalassiosira exigua]
SSLSSIESSMGCEFGSPSNPLLLSVRSGAAVSMPGMMDTVLNLGTNDASCEGLAKKTGNPRFAYDSYRRFLEMFGNVVLDLPRSAFEDEIDDVKHSKGVFEDSDLTAEDLREVVARFKEVYAAHGATFPQDALEQLRLAVGAVFRGWTGHRAVRYREVEGIRDLLGTAVNVQAMVVSIVFSRVRLQCIPPCASLGRSRRLSPRDACLTLPPPARPLPIPTIDPPDRSSGTWATPPGRGCASPAIRTTERTSSSESSWSTPRERTSWPASGLRGPSRSWRRSCPVSGWQMLVVVSEGATDWNGGGMGQCAADARLTVILGDVRREGWLELNPVMEHRMEVRRVESGQVGSLAGVAGRCPSRAER